MRPDVLVFGVGFAAQLLFAARMIVQWLKSEWAGQVVSPLIFWYLSLAGSFLLLVYGVCREDIVIVSGQVLIYYIYIRNLDLKNEWSGLPVVLRLFLLIFPFITLLTLFFSTGDHMARLVHHKEIPWFLLIWGGIGQTVFLFRFVVQWLCSERLKASVLPFQFWMLSLIGSVMLLGYAVFRRDPVIFIGQIFGTTVYVRNIMILHRQIKAATI